MVNQPSQYHYNFTLNLENLRQCFYRNRCSYFVPSNHQTVPSNHQNFLNCHLMVSYELRQSYLPYFFRCFVTAGIDKAMLHCAPLYVHLSSENHVVKTTLKILVD